MRRGRYVHAGAVDELVGGGRAARQDRPRHSGLDHLRGRYCTLYPLCRQPRPGGTLSHLLLSLLVQHSALTAQEETVCLALVPPLNIPPRTPVQAPSPALLRRLQAPPPPDGSGPKAVSLMHRSYEGLQDAVGRTASLLEEMREAVAGLRRRADALVRDECGGWVGGCWARARPHGVGGSLVTLGLGQKGIII